MTLRVTDDDTADTGYSCTDNGQSLTLTLSTDTPPHGTATLGDGVQTLSCTASASSTSTPSSATTATIQVDRTCPVITAPVANQQLVFGQALALACADPTGADETTGSGLAACQVTVTLPDGSRQTVNQGDDVPAGQIGTYVVTPNTVTDVAGNADTTVIHYTVGYAVTALPGSTTIVNQGYHAVIRVAPEDANGENDARRNLTVTSVELDGPNGQTIPFVHQFQFGRFSGQAGYQLSLNTRNLTPGSWTMQVQVGNDQAIYGIAFTVK